MTVPFIPILTMDVLGSLALVVFALLALYKARILRELDTDNAVFLYLLWISAGFAVFAVSRSVGHILKQLLVLSGNTDIWQAISPYSGGINTVSFMMVSMITLFFHQSWKINEKILSGRKALEETHTQLKLLNQTLEQKVVERTERLTRADKLAALRELSAGVAHEINNPLGIILGYTQLLLKDNPGCEEDLKTIEKHVKNCRNVVSDLLSFSRKGPAEMRRVDVTQVIENVIKFLSNHTDFRNVDICLSLYRETPLTVIGNEQELSQVILNLMINACHAVEKKGCIEIQTGKTQDGRMVITVKDNGSGIRKDHLSRIFDPFFTTKPVGQGTGLGLSVNYGIIRRHGGDITARNRTEKGAAFTITLPAQETGGKT